MSENSYRERLARIEEIVLRIEAKLDNHIVDDKAVERRVSRLEQLGASVTTVFTMVGVYLGLKP